MGVIFYKVDECCGDIEFKIVDPFKTKEVGPNWCMSKEQAIDDHDYLQDSSYLNLEAIRCLIKENKKLRNENKKLQDEISHLEDKMDSAYVSFQNDGLYT